MTDKEQLIELYREMYELTAPECAAICRVPHSCCSPEYCEMSEEIAKEHWNIDVSGLKTKHPVLPFMGEKGCVLPPHLRPLCTVHTCDISAFGAKMKPSLDEAWTKNYFELREKIDELESRFQP